MSESPNEPNLNEEYPEGLEAEDQEVDATDLVMTTATDIVSAVFGGSVVTGAVLIVEFINDEGEYQLIPVSTKNLPSWRRTGMLDAIAQGIRDMDAAVDVAYEVQELLTPGSEDEQE